MNDTRSPFSWIVFYKDNLIHPQLELPSILEEIEVGLKALKITKRGSEISSLPDDQKI